jgi:hypothetical protein
VKQKPPPTAPPEVPSDSAIQTHSNLFGQPAPSVDPKVLDDPLFQQLVKEFAEAKEHIKAQAFVLETLAGVFRECEVATEAMSSEDCTQALRNRLNDARSLYRVMHGEQKASELLAAIEKLIAPEIFASIVLDLSIFLAPHLQKLVQELSEPRPDGTNPAVVAAMLVTGLKGWEVHRPIFELRMLIVQQLQRKIHELCSEAGITDVAEKQGIEDGISRTVGADVFALAQLESGDFTDVERLFAERTKQRISIQ